LQDLEFRARKIHLQSVPPDAGAEQLMTKAHQTGFPLPRLVHPELSGLELPEDSPYRRDMPLPAARRTEKYVANFDTRTLVYDAVEGKQRISLFCPRLLNLWPLLRDGLRLDGATIRLRRHRFLRFERLDLPKGAKGVLSVEIDGLQLPLPVHSAAADLFAGLDTMITMVKDTPAQWIIDWVNYHMSAHGAGGLVMLDNGSDPDLMQETVIRLEAETSLTQIAIVSVPFPYGGNAGGRFVAPAKYLQVAMLNLMRARFLGQASGILSVDVDEFVQPMPNGQPHRTIFDLARSGSLGCVSFVGQWAFAPTTTGPQPQRDHSHTDADHLCKSPKWCLVPGGLADRFVLAVHRPAGPLFALTSSTQTRYWHFRATTTGWKSPRFQTEIIGSVDPDLAKALQDHLPPLMEIQETTHTAEDLHASDQ
jgi:hypothetical protein